MEASPLPATLTAYADRHRDIRQKRFSFQPAQTLLRVSPSSAFLSLSIAVGITLVIMHPDVKPLSASAPVEVAIVFKSRVPEAWTFAALERRGPFASRLLQTIGCTCEHKAVCKASSA